MESALNLDTTFLIDLQKERRQRKEGPAFRVLALHPDAALRCSVVAWGEFLEGLPGEGLHPLAIALRAHIHVFPLTEGIAEMYARCARSLRADGKLLGANDLWIAAAALEREEPLVTRNARDFARISDLRIISY